jgi:trigger factor
LAVIEGCKHELEISIPLEDVEQETGRVLENVKKRARIPGFRPGKVPASLIRKQFEGEIRQQVLETLIPKYLQKQFEAEDLRVVGTPNISDVHFHPGEPLRFKAEFEVVPDIELKDYKGLSVVYHDPEITDADVDRRLEELREARAEYVNVDPKPVEDGDYAVVALESTGGVEGPPVKNDEMVLHIGSDDTFEAFSTNLRGVSPGEEKEFEVTYPADYGQNRLSGKTVRFRAHLKGIRRKELPELNDEFAKDMGDYLNLDELRDAVKKSLLAQRQFEAQQEAKNKLIESLVDMHEFPVPEAFVENQLKNRVEQQLRALAGEGVDPESVKLDWKKVKETQGEKALREVKASMLLSRIAEREAIAATRDEVDREVERLARQQREPFAALRLKLEKNGALGRLASHIQTEKTLSFLFEHAQKTTE